MIERLQNWQLGMLVRGTIWETFWFPFSGRACATLLFPRETTGTQVWAHPHRFMPTDIGSAPGSVSEPGMPATKWSCTTRSDAGDGDAQNSCEITVLAFQTFRQNILSLICMYIYVVCLSDSQLTQFRNFGLHGLPKRSSHMCTSFLVSKYGPGIPTHKCSPFQK